MFALGKAYRIAETVRPGCVSFISAAGEIMAVAKLGEAYHGQISLTRDQLLALGEEISLGQLVVRARRLQLTAHRADRGLLLIPFQFTIHSLIAVNDNGELRNLIGCFAEPGFNEDRTDVRLYVYDSLESPIPVLALGGIK